MLRKRPRSELVLMVGLGVAAVAVASAIIPRASDVVGWVGLAAAVAALIAFAITLMVPVHWLPMIALVMFVAIPRSLVPSDGILNALPVLSIIMVIWLVRRMVAGTVTGHIPSDRSVSDRSVLDRSVTEHSGTTRSVTRIVIQVSAAVFVLWSLLSSLTSADGSTAFAWLTSFSIGALIPILVTDARAEAALVRTAWIICGGVMGAYAILEIGLQSSPLYGAIYGVLGVPSGQHWSVYRAEGSFYHPLYAGAFLAVGAALGIALWLQSGTRWTLAMGLVSAVGVVATVSRGSIIATAAAVGVAVVVAGFTVGRKVAPRLVVVSILGVVAAVGLANFGALNERSDSAEAELSGGARDAGLEIALKAAASSDWLGSGPGTSGIRARLFDDVVIENSGLQLLISVGIPGLALMVILVAALVVNSLKSKDAASAAAFIAYVVCILGFNAIDALRGMHLLIGLLILITLNPIVRDSSIGLDRRAPARSLARIPSR
jgi:polysaccharide biosynthesis protein PslJ